MVSLSGPKVWFSWLSLCQCSVVHGTTWSLCICTICDWSNLDVILTCGISSVIWRCPVNVDPCLYDAKCNQCSDHIGIKVPVDCSKPQKYRMGITYHGLHDICLPDFINDIKSSVMPFSKRWHYRWALEVYNSSFKALRGRHAPLTEGEHSLVVRCSLVHRGAERSKT